MIGHVVQAAGSGRRAQAVAAFTLTELLH